MSDILIDKKQHGFNELRFVCLASDWTGNSNRQDLELVGIDVDISGIEGKVSVASDGARIHIFHGLRDKVKIESGYYWVRKVTKTKVELDRCPRDDEPVYFAEIQNIMFESREEISLPDGDHKSAAVCKIILEMKRPFNLRFMSEAMGYHSGLKPLRFAHRFLRVEDNGDTVYSLKILGESWESYVIPLRVKE